MMTELHEAKDPQAGRATSRVLVVDDHPVTRAGIAQLIESQIDLEVCGQAKDLPTAFAKVLDSKPDLLALDLTLGKESSIAHFGRLREHDPSLPILVISMHDEMTHGYRAVSEGANGYVQKDAEPDEILRAIHTVLDGGTAVSPRLAAMFVSATKGKGPEGKVMNLSAREFEVYQLIGIGMATREIAAKLGISARTVEAHKENIKKKLNLKSAAELARHAAQCMQGNGPPGH